MEEETLSFVDRALELLEEKQYPTLRLLLNDQMAADINEFFEELPMEKIIVLYRLLPKELAAEVFVEMDPEQQEYLIGAFSDAELRATLGELYYDDTADIIEEMPANVVKRILNNCDPEMRKAVNELLKYPEDSAGSLMTTEFVRLKKNYTVEASFDLIRRVGIDKETIYTCYVTDEKSHLIGIVTVKDLLLAPLQRLIEDIMTENVISVNTLDDQEQIALMFSKYDFIALPVVDNEQRLVGIITVDDAIDVLQEETEEDFAKMAAITPNDTEYLRTPVFRIWASRVPWLLLLIVQRVYGDHVLAHHVLNQILQGRQQQVLYGYKADQMAFFVRYVAGVNGLFVDAYAADQIEGRLYGVVLFQPHELGGHQAAGAVLGVFQQLVHGLAHFGVAVV